MNNETLIATLNTVCETGPIELSYYTRFPDSCYAWVDGECLHFTAVEAVKKAGRVSIARARARRKRHFAAANVAGYKVMRNGKWDSSLGCLRLDDKRVCFDTDVEAFYHATDAGKHGYITDPKLIARLRACHLALPDSAEAEERCAVEEVDSRSPEREWLREYEWLRRP